MRIARERTHRDRGEPIGTARVSRQTPAVVSEIYDTVTMQAPGTVIHVEQKTFEVPRATQETESRRLKATSCQMDGGQKGCWQ